MSTSLFLVLCFLSTKIAFAARASWKNSFGNCRNAFSCARDVTNCNTFLLHRRSKHLRVQVDISIHHLQQNPMTFQ